MRKRSVVMAVVSLGVLGCATSGSSATSTTTASSAAAHCGPFDATTLAASGVVRVYAIGKVVYGCSMHGSGAFRLGQRTLCIGAARIDPVVVAGELAAYGYTRCGVDTGFSQVVVRRLTDGKVLRSAPATTPAGVESYQAVGSVVLRRDAAVAWIGTGKSIVGHGTPKIEVYKADHHGKVTLLDSGLAVKPASLSLRGSRLSWKDGSAMRHATLS